MASSDAKSDLQPVLMACCLAMLAVGDNSTAIMAALPAMTGDLRLGSAEVEWVVNAYLLTAAMFIVVGGDAADQFGARRSSIAGIALFALASLFIALAPAGFVVVGARALQGRGPRLRWPARSRRSRKQQQTSGGRKRSAPGAAF
jgi:MFS family permease